MNKLLAHFFTAVLASVAFAAGPAKADFVPWTYNFTPSQTSFGADVPGTGGLTLTNEPLNHAEGTSDVVITNIRTFSSAPRTNPDKFTHAGYTFTLVLKDDASGQTATLKFGGFFTGSVSINSANILNTFTAPVLQTVKLGGHTYSISLGSYAPPGPPSASNAGSINVHVAVDEFTPGGGTGSHGAPEPSSLLLAGTGLSFLGAAGWRKWKSRGLVRELAYA
jgi:hypothetical protein